MMEPLRGVEENEVTGGRGGGGATLEWNVGTLASSYLLASWP